MSIQFGSRDDSESRESAVNGPEVRVHIVHSTPQRPAVQPPDGSLVPVTADDIGTQVSSSDSNKPASMDGKSVASGTTFNALDEKESLRPDDSASVKAVEDEDLYSASGSGLPSRIGSDDGVRAFRDQLQEISAMEPSRRDVPTQAYANVPKGVLYVPPQGPGIGAVPSTGRPPASTPGVECPPDQKLLEALENPRDRVWVLKLEQDVIDFVKDPKESSLTLPQCHSFYRLLAHKMADYYMLGHLIDDTSAAVRLYKTEDCRIPPPLTGITAPSTAASTPPPSAPAMKILRRGDRDGPAIANGSNSHSKTVSENGDSGDEKKKAPATREEREARYEAARLRIMGSAKPSDSPEIQKEKQDSRSSSAAGKKKKKARNDDDDGFDPRSAYGTYYATPLGGSDGMQTPAYGFPQANDHPAHSFQQTYPQQAQHGTYQNMIAQSSNHQNWNQQGFHGVDSTSTWAQTQSNGYDIASDFQRMSLQQSQAPPAYGQNYSQNYSQQYYSPQQAWQQGFSTHGQNPQPGYNHGSGYATGAGGYSGEQMQATYAFGQLPSQAFPGRPANKNEHPLPGSYKGKNFNPQSQTFIPGQPNGSPITPNGVPSGPSNFGSPFAAQSPIQAHRQNSMASPSSSFGSSHQQQQHAMQQQNRIPSQPLTHPLPQGPVFPKQPSPHVPLPPKPGNMSAPLAQMAAPPAHMQQSQSLLAKWGTPASLPAKPPPSKETSDAGKASQNQRQPYMSSPPARQQANNYAAFSGMPQAPIINGAVAPKRS